MNKYNSQFFAILLLYLISGITNKTVSQEQSLWLMNGKKITVTGIQLDSTDSINPQIIFANKKGKQKKLFTDEVFSFTGIDSKEIMIYHHQPELGETLSVIEMRDFLIGLNDAKKYNVSPWLIMGGYTSGLVGAFVPNPELKLGENTMPIPIGILIPAAYVGVSGMLSPNAEDLINKTPIPNPTDTYLMGYQEGVRKKIIKNSLLSAGVGFVAGFIILVAAN